MTTTTSFTDQRYTQRRIHFATDDSCETFFSPEDWTDRDAFRHLINNYKS